MVTSQIIHTEKQAAGWLWWPAWSVVGLSRKCQLEAYPLRCVYGRQCIQISHRKLDPLPLQLLIYVHDTCEVRTAPEGISPRLQGEERLLGCTCHQGLPRCLQSSPGPLSEASALLYSNACCPSQTYSVPLLPALP